MKIEILGSACAKCKTLYANAQKAAQELGIQPEIAKVDDIAKILSYGVMTTPALVVDGVVQASGRVLSPEEIKKLIS